MSRSKSGFGRLAAQTAFGVLALAYSAQSFAALRFTQVSTIAAVEFTDTSAFLDSRFVADIVYTYRADRPGDIGAFGFNFGQTSQNVSLTSSNDASLAISNLVAGPSSVRARLTSVDGVSQNITMHFERVPSGATISSIILGDLNVLRITSTIAPGAAAEALTAFVSLPGDWSSSGTSTGQHNVLQLNPLWTIDNNFEFDGLATNFSARISNYIPQSGQELGLTFDLYGARVGIPSPSMLSVIVWSFCLAGYLSYRSRTVRHGRRFMVNNDRGPTVAADSA